MPYKDKEKQRQYVREWLARRRASYFDGKQCKHCGCEDNLVLHHCDPEIKESHKIWSWGKERREAELAKCIVLCDSCHRKVHRTSKHGSHVMYQYHKCHCDICREHHSAQARIYRSQK